MAKDDVYYPPIVQKCGRHTAIVLKPILTDEERARREKQLIAAAERLLLEKELLKLRKERERAEQTN